MFGWSDVPEPPEVADLGPDVWRGDKTPASWFSACPSGIRRSSKRGRTSVCWRRSVRPEPTRLARPPADGGSRVCGGTSWVPVAKAEGPSRLAACPCAQRRSRRCTRDHAGRPRLRTHRTDQTRIGQENGPKNKTSVFLRAIGDQACAAGMRVAKGAIGAIGPDGQVVLCPLSRALLLSHAGPQSMLPMCPRFHVMGCLIQVLGADVRPGVALSKGSGVRLTRRRSDLTQMMISIRNPKRISR